MVNILQIYFSLSYIGPTIFLFTFLFNNDYLLSVFVSIQVSDAYVNVFSIIVFFSFNFSFFDMCLFLKKKSFCNIRYVLLAFLILSCKKKILSTPSFGGEVKPSVPCPIFAACKRSLHLRGSRNLGKITGQFLAHSSTFRC